MLAYPVTDTFAQRNQNMTVEEAAAGAAAMIAAAHDGGRARHRDARRRVRLPVRGARRSRRVVEHAGRMAAAGADEIMLADTIGVGVPAPGAPARARRRGAAAGDSPSACTSTTRATPATPTPTPGSSTA